MHRPSSDQGIFTFYCENQQPSTITTPVFVASAYDSANPDFNQANKYHQFSALWDTGAEITIISQQIAEKLSLISIGQNIIRGVTGEQISLIYLVSIIFSPHNASRTEGIAIQNHAVSEVKEIGGADMLIGMDIINLGEIRIGTTPNQVKFFSFRVPAQGDEPYRHSIA